MWYLKVKLSLRIQEIIRLEIEYYTELDLVSFWLCSLLSISRAKKKEHKRNVSFTSRLIFIIGIIGNLNFFVYVCENNPLLQIDNDGLIL
jgi:hypothetical protein